MIDGVTMSLSVFWYGRTPVMSGQFLIFLPQLRTIGNSTKICTTFIPLSNIKGSNRAKLQPGYTRETDRRTTGQQPNEMKYWFSASQRWSLRRFRSWTMLHSRVASLSSALLSPLMVFNIKVRPVGQGSQTMGHGYRYRSAIVCSVLDAIKFYKQK